MPHQAAFRVVQEGLTNATKHAHGAAVGVRLAMAGGEAVVSVRNAGPLRATAAGGHGLAGLSERVRLAGGVLHAGPTPDGGFEVTARLPLTATPAAPLDARREFDRARRRMRRAVIDAVSVPAVTLGVLLVLNVGYHLNN